MTCQNTVWVNVLIHYTQGSFTALVICWWMIWFDQGLEGCEFSCRFLISPSQRFVILLPEFTPDHFRHNFESKASNCCLLFSQQEYKLKLCMPIINFRVRSTKSMTTNYMYLKIWGCNKRQHQTRIDLVWEPNHLPSQHRSVTHLHTSRHIHTRLFLGSILGLSLDNHHSEEPAFLHQRLICCMLILNKKPRYVAAVACMSIDPIISNLDF